MTEPQSQLARHVPAPALSEAQVKALGARAWNDHETLVVRLSLVTDPMIRQMVRTIAADQFGGARF